MANVQGKFYRGETQRSGVTPTSPPNAVDEPVGPLNPPGSGSTTTYKQLGDTTDKSFMGKNGYIPVVVNENALTLQPNIPNTGVAVFGGVAFNSTTTVDIGIVKGYIVDNETDPLVSSIQYIEYAGATGVTVTTVGSGTRSYGLLKSDGTIHFQNTFPTSEDRKEMIYLFKVGHPSGSITVVANEPDFVLSPLQQFRDLFQAFNYVNEGVYPYPDAADLTFNTSAGIIVGNGINFVADTLNPNTLPVSASIPCTFVYRTQTGAGGTPTTLITPNSYDNAGTITTIGGGANRSTLQYIHYSPNLGFVIQYGQTIYDSLVEAIAAIGKETHVVYENLIRDALLIGVLALKRTTTDLTDTDDARFYRADIFGQLVGSAAGTSVTTLQRAYLNSLIPQIETVSGELVIKNGGALDTDVVFAIRDLLDVDNFTVTGDGDVTANSFIKSGGTSNQYLKADGSVSGVSPYILDQEGASDGDVLTWVAANSRYEPVAGGGGGISGLTTNRIPVATSATTIADSQITQESTSSWLYGNRTLTSTPTPLKVSLGGTIGNNTAGSSNNIKLKIYDDGNPVNDSGIGVGSGLLEIRAGVSGGIALFVNDGVERFRISSSGAITASQSLTITGGSSGAQTPLVVTATGTETRIKIDHPTNSGFGLFINNVKKWSVASYNTNFDFTIYNDARVRIGFYYHGLTNNGVFCDQNTTPSDNGYRLEVIGTFRVTGNGLFGTTTSTGTATPLSVSFGGTFGTNTPGAVGNMKWYLYQDSTPGNSYGIGMSASLMEIRAGTGAAVGFFPNNGVEAMRILSTGNLQFADAKNIVFNTTTGTKIATATTQKMAFWNKTPIIQPTTGITGATFVSNAGTTVTSTDTFGGYTIAQLAAILINTGLTA